MAREYHGRVVLELVQNAHDALPKGRRDGRILVEYLAEGEFGTLVVANSGNPFSHSDFESLRKVAVSDKPPEEAIGNKGIGFKSVVEVCDSPAVYSAWSADSGAFDGYCFRFPRPEDIGELIPDDPAGARQVADEMLLLGLPIPAEPDEPWLDRIAEAGYVTVVALPLRSAAAEQSVLEQLASLVDDTAPILLFLDRVAELRVAGIPAEEDEVSGEVVLTRSVALMEHAGICRQVDLGSAGTYVVATAGLSSDDLAEALQESMDLRLVDRRWDDWHGDVEVSAAVRIDGPIGVGRRYTHLPMGPDARSPVAAHLDAPFYANISRTDAVEDVPFNARLMDELACCCLRAAVEMRSVAEPWARAASVDFLAWDAAQRDRWLRAADSVGLSPAGDSLVPAVSAVGPGWATFEQAGRWVELTDDRAHVINAEAVIAAGALLADGALGEERLDRLDVVGWWAGNDLTLDDDQLAGWIESIAVELHGAPFRADRWEAFYDDLDALNRRGLGSDALSGRPILLTAGGELRQAGERRGRGVRKGTASVTFFNPADDEDDPLTLNVPASLKDEIAFMHRGIDWNLRDGHVRKRPGREFLERAGLVRDYKADGVVTALRQLLTGRRAKALHADALRFAFDLFRGVPPDKQKAFARIPFLLPSCSQKLIPADQALLSPAWGTEAGALLGELIARCGPMADEVAALEARLVDPPDGLEPTADRVTFLLSVGVTDGLPTIPLTMPWPSVQGQYAKDQTWLGAQMGLTDLDARRWHDDVHDRGLGYLNPYTAYRFSHPPQALVAQAEHDALDLRGKELFAELVALGLSSWPDAALRVVLQKVSRPLENPQTIPTPLASFLRYAGWIPVAEPGQRDELTYAAPADVWHHTGRDQRPPAFAPLASRRFRAAALQGRVLARLRVLGLNVWDDPDDAAALVAHLGTLLHHDGIRLVAAGEFKNHYAAAWHEVVTRGDVDPFDGVEQPFLVATVGHELQAVDLRARTEPLVVPCTAGRGVTDRLELLGVTVVPVDPTDGPAVVERLRPHLAGVVVRSDDVEVSVVVDDEPLDPTAGIPLIVPERDWLATLILTALELGGSPFRRRGEQGLRNAADRLRLARVVFATEAQVRTGVGGSVLQILPTRPLAVDHDEAPVVVVVGPTQWSWELLESLGEPVADLLRQPDLAATIGLALMRLQRELDGPVSPSTDEVVLTSSLLARLLGVPEHDVGQVWQTLRSSLVSVLDRLYPALCVLVGDDEAALFDPEAPGLDDGDAVLSALQALGDRLAVSTAVSPDELLAAAEDAIPLHEFVDRVGLDFAAFNGVLARLAERGLPYTPMHNADGHLRAFDEFVTTHRRDRRPAARAVARRVPLGW